MQMPNRHTNTNEYRFGYNGMEKDKEIKGDGNSYTTEFRQYDPRLGRWLSLDPLMGKFPNVSPYVAFDNNPVYYIDPYGLESGTGQDKSIDGDPPRSGDSGSECDDGKPLSETHDWVQKNVFGDDTDIIKALERENVGGYGKVNVKCEVFNKKSNAILTTGYICKVSDNYQKDKYYSNSTFETGYKQSGNAENSPYPKNSIYKETVSNSLIIHDKYVYHTKTIVRTEHFFNYLTGKYEGTFITTSIIEQYQLYDNDYESENDIILDYTKFYSKVTEHVGKGTMNKVPLTQEIIDLVNNIMLDYQMSGAAVQLAEDFQGFMQDGLKATADMEGAGDLDVEPPISTIWKSN